MKKIFFTIALLVIAVFGAQAMSYDQAREQAAFLTDKMAYELNMTDEQYDAAYEINLDYLMSVNTVEDVYADDWEQRNYDMAVVLEDWQWDAFCRATYFFRPLYWDSGFWHFGVYAYYPERDFYYFDRPAVYATYRGGHSWRCNGGRSWYDAHPGGFRPRPGTCGMRDMRIAAGGSRQGMSSGGFRHNISAESSRPGMSGGFRQGMVNGGSRPGMSAGGYRSGGWRSNSYSMTNRQSNNGGMRQSSTRSTVGSGGMRTEMRTRSTNSSYEGSHSSFGGSNSSHGNSFNGGGFSGSSNRGGSSFSGGGSRGGSSFSGGSSHGGSGGSGGSGSHGGGGSRGGSGGGPGGHR